MIDILVMAAGSGKRMGAGKNKVFLELAGIPILYLTLKRLQACSEISNIYPVIKEEEAPIFQEMLTQFGNLGKVKKPIIGGQERADSVRNGLKQLYQSSGAEVIMVHDGARPFFSNRMIQELEESAKKYDCAIPVMPVVETTRQVINGQGKIINRDELNLVQTPQAFLRKNIYEYFLDPDQTLLNLTDEASFFEEKGKPIHFIEGEKYNIKITQPQDLEWAKALIYAFEELKI